MGNPAQFAAPASRGPGAVNENTTRIVFAVNGAGESTDMNPAQFAAPSSRGPGPAGPNTLRVVIADDSPYPPPTPDQYQNGSIDVEAGTQFYDVVFDPPFADIPASFIPTFEMADDNAELFWLGYAGLSASGVRVWLGGIPTAASVGSKIRWEARL